jgi:hypothetical protein
LLRVFSANRVSSISLGDARLNLLSEISAGTGNEKMTPWRDQAALVPGGTRGIGRATARLLAQCGAAVCVNYVAHADAAEGVAVEIMAAGGRAIAAMADVAEGATVEMMVTRAEKALGPAGPRLLFALRSSGSDFLKLDWAFDKMPLAFRAFFATSDLCAQLIYFAGGKLGRLVLALIRSRTSVRRGKLSDYTADRLGAAG